MRALLCTFSPCLPLIVSFIIPLTTNLLSSFKEVPSYFFFLISGTFFFSRFPFLFSFPFFFFFRFPLFHFLMVEKEEKKIGSKTKQINKQTKKVK